MSAELPRGKLHNVAASFELTDVFAFPYLLELIEQVAQKHGVDTNIGGLRLFAQFEWNEGTGDFEAFRDALKAKQVFFDERVSR